MSIKILKPGILATLQDSGRHDYRHIGVGSGGAMDYFAYKVANYLCGNEDDAAVLEMHFPAPEIEFESDALISITGADFSPQLNGNKISCWKTLTVKSGDILKFVEPGPGSRSYLAVTGGWQAQSWLGSFSTHIKLQTGGHFGRALRKDDTVAYASVQSYGLTAKGSSARVSSIELNKIYQSASMIRCVCGPEYEQLTPAGKCDFEEQLFTVGNESDRMGFRLEATPLERHNASELISSPADHGTIQLLPNGNCIVLMADHQTTGGYARIAAVVKADLPKLAQARPGNKLNFKLVSIEEAEGAFFSMLDTLQQIKTATAINIQIKNG